MPSIPDYMVKLLVGDATGPIGYGLLFLTRKSNPTRRAIRIGSNIQPTSLFFRLNCGR